MIVNYTESGWQIIAQRAHGLLAAQLCAQWKKENQPGRWVETLIATAEHDDAYNEFDNPNLINENGGPVDFKITPFEQKYGQLLINMAVTKSAYIALLVSRHIQFVHGNDQKAKQFIRDLKKQEKKWMKVAATTDAEVQRGYDLLEFCDAFSLLLCQGLIQPEERKIEISNGPDGTAYEMYAENDMLVVAPWPFEKDSFTVTYESRCLSQLRFKDTTEFHKNLKVAVPKTHCITISKLSNS